MVGRTSVSLDGWAVPGLPFGRASGLSCYAPLLFWLTESSIDSCILKLLAAIGPGPHQHSARPTLKLDVAPSVSLAPLVRCFWKGFWFGNNVEQRDTKDVGYLQVTFV
jgi:hypothetical protein